jgi:hypothetical protein
MSEDDTQAALDGLHAVMTSGGLLCVAGLTGGVGPASRLASGLWTRVFRLNPRLVGGCRPIRLAERLASGEWRLLHRDVVVNAMIPSEAIVAERV